MFSLLGIQLLIINIKLLRVMKRIFGEHIMEKNFKHELRFLISRELIEGVALLVVDLTRGGFWNSACAFTISARRY